MRPVDVNEANEGTVWQNLYGNESTKSTKYKFKVDYPPPHIAFKGMPTMTS